jgi:hypothetical protein
LIADRVIFRWLYISLLSWWRLLYWIDISLYDWIDSLNTVTTLNTYGICIIFLAEFLSSTHYNVRYLFLSPSDDPLKQSGQSAYDALFLNWSNWLFLDTECLVPLLVEGQERLPLKCDLKLVVCVREDQGRYECGQVVKREVVGGSDFTGGSINLEPRRWKLKSKGRQYAGTFG